MIFDNKVDIVLISLDRRRTIDVGQPGEEVHGVLVFAARWLTDPTEGGSDEEEEVHEEGHPDNLPPPGDITRGEDSHPGVIITVVTEHLVTVITGGSGPAAARYHLMSGQVLDSPGVARSLQ